MQVRVLCSHAGQTLSSGVCGLRASARCAFSCLHGGVGGRNRSAAGRKAVDGRRPDLRAGQGRGAVGEAHRRQIERQDCRPRLSRRSAGDAGPGARIHRAARWRRGPRRRFHALLVARRSSSSTWSRCRGSRPTTTTLAVIGGRAVAPRVARRGRARRRRAARDRPCWASRTSRRPPRRCARRRTSPALKVRAPATPLLTELFVGLGALPQRDGVRGCAGRVPRRHA